MEGKQNVREAQEVKKIKGNIKARREEGKTNREDETKRRHRWRRSGM